MLRLPEAAEGLHPTLSGLRKHVPLNVTSELIVEGDGRSSGRVSRQVRYVFGIRIMTVRVRHLEEGRFEDARVCLPCGR